MMKNQSVLAPSFLPATVVIETTYKCNHSCLFCSCPWEAPNSNFVKHSELTVPEWKKVIKTLVENGILNIAFSGGEPLLKEGIEELLEYSSSLKATYIESINNKLVKKIAPPKLFVISNGGLMNENFLEKCKRFNVNLSMSLPGMQTYNYHTKNGEPEDILHWFKFASQLGIHTTVNITATKLNINELYETISNAFIAGADYLLLNRFLPGGRGLKYRDELFLSVEETNEMLEIAEKVLITANRKGSVGTELPKCLIRKDDYKNLKIGAKCSAAIDFFTIDPSGFIRACNHSENRILHFSEYEKLKTNEMWKTFVMKNYKPEMCKNCKFQYVCDGGCREAANICGKHLNSKDPLF